MKKIKLFLITLIYIGAIYGQEMNIEVNSMAKAYSIDSIQINAPINKVYSIIANINDWPKWLDGVTEVHINGDAEVGKAFIWKAKGYKIKSKIHTVRLNSDIGWIGKMWWIRAIHNWHFESVPTGGTKVIVKECFAGFCSALFQNSLKKDMRSDLICLKKGSEK